METDQSDYLQLNITVKLLARINTKGLFYLAAGLLGATILAFVVIILEPGPVLYFSMGWFTVISFLMWIGNRFLTRSLDKTLPWSRWGNIRFFTQLIAGVAWLLLLINGAYYSIKTPLTGTPPSMEQLTVANVWGIIIFVPVFSIYFSMHFLRHWRQSELEMERFQKENIRSQLDSLKNHLDPHFLFNNLNILSSLIDKNKEASKEFIHKFAEVYRSILRSKAEDLVLLSEEMKFIEAYIFLIKTRFEENIQFKIDVTSYDKMLPPLTVQMLIENAIKHNIITETEPLVISITEKGSELIIGNNLNKARSETSSGTGINNIRRRYLHFTEKPIDVSEQNGRFEVRIPLLEIEHS